MHFSRKKHKSPIYDECQSSQHRFWPWHKKACDYENPIIPHEFQSFLPFLLSMVSQIYSKGHQIWNLRRRFCMNRHDERGHTHCRPLLTEFGTLHRLESCVIGPVCFKKPCLSSEYTDCIYGKKQCISIGFETNKKQSLRVNLYWHEICHESINMPKIKYCQKWDCQKAVHLLAFDLKGKLLFDRKYMTL